MTTSDDGTRATPAGGSGGQGPKLRLNTSRTKSSYCNVCNATSTREEVVLSFGLHQSWDAPDGEVEIDVQHRVIMNPFAARKLRDVLNELIDGYEARYGSLED